MRALDGLIELHESDEGDIIVHTTRLEFAQLLQGANGRVRPPHPTA
ncbi:hypothetical protein [Streptomyces sp. NRRL WC-3742]|nr:hypothetical protein [Streptomyces sp. NRRL WC-3742]